ncbi:unnamed protein product [Mytilus edulis]|uniref:AIG1-type G domain-containing protein n=1 Tax=Mytilus edulis TaxID=6550 RepID=A0A8S3R5R3_MYTED|nr:unnamed protein product [Mytilus edulis]
MCIRLSSPGPHAIVLCVPIGRFTDEDVETVNHFCENFGENLAKYVIVLFTRYDDLKREMERTPNHPGMNKFIDSLRPSLREFLSKCRNRYIEFDNTLVGTSADSQVQRLIEMVENMVRENGGSSYTDVDYQRQKMHCKNRLRKTGLRGKQKSKKLNKK